MGHQCLSAVRSLLGIEQVEKQVRNLGSPMPVGCSVPVGLKTLLLGLQLWGKSPMPVGCSVPVGLPSRQNWNGGTGVTNACRLFGPCWGFNSICPETGKPMSPMPVGCSVPVGWGSLSSCGIIICWIVTNACRLFGPCWGP